MAFSSSPEWRCAHAGSTTPRLRCVQAAPRGPPCPSAARPTRWGARRTPPCTDGPSPSWRRPAERGILGWDRRGPPLGHGQPPAKVSLGACCHGRGAGPAAATYLSNLMLRRQDFGEELQVNLSILWTCSGGKGVCVPWGLWTITSGDQVEWGRTSQTQACRNSCATAKLQVDHTATESWGDTDTMISYGLGPPWGRVNTRRGQAWRSTSTDAEGAGGGTGETGPENTGIGWVQGCSHTRGGCLQQRDCRLAASEPHRGGAARPGRN